mgnify:CR=1 FL=1
MNQKSAFESKEKEKTILVGSSFRRLLWGNKWKKPECTIEQNQQIDNGKELQSWHNSKPIFKEVDMGQKVYATGRAYGL